MSCDLQRLLASAADLPPVTPREPSVGERIMQDLLRLDAEMDRQRRLDRSAALGYPGTDLPAHTLDALELMQGVERMQHGLPFGPRHVASTLLHPATGGLVPHVLADSFPVGARPCGAMSAPDWASTLPLHRELRPRPPAVHLHVHVHAKP